MHVDHVNPEKGFVELLIKVILQVEQRGLQTDKDPGKVSCVVLDKLNHQIKTFHLGLGAIKFHCNVALCKIVSIGLQPGGRGQWDLVKRQGKGCVVLPHGAGSKHCFGIVAWHRPSEHL